MNIPIPFTYEQDPEVVFPEMGIRRWRKVFIIEWHNGVLNFGWTTQLRYNTHPWIDLHASCMVISLTVSWEWGEKHFYYDGPHCIRNYGFISVSRGGDWNCKQCCPPEEV